MDLKKQNTLLIILLIISVLIIGVLSGFLISNKLNEKDNDTSLNDFSENNDLQDDNENSYLGLYTVKYNSNASENIRNNMESSLLLKDDNTFIFNYNVCSGMLEVTGDYVIDNERVVLSNLQSGYQDVLIGNLNGEDTLTFVIVSYDEIYLDLEEDLACTISGNKYGSFVK